ncbi:MAG TPA: 3-dehydroquinate synthase [Candidatus Acidoferrales bacterium]|nr:3-dehydroquinate synthase [Candidatus Acidoferrales bacterium]
MRTLTVNLDARSYPISIGAGMLSRAGELLAPLVAGKKTAVITNPTVSRLYLKPLRDSLAGAGANVSEISIPDGEEHKNLATLGRVYDQLIEKRFERACVLVALGGGVVGDLAGFAAATFLRGVPYVQIPTTLLAQVDSSVGGKTGINHREGKNLIGAFYQPRAVLIDVDVLRTLPRRELAAGLAEVMKYGVIMDPALFALLEEKLEPIMALDEGLLVEMIGASCADKARVVEKDETEGDERAVLNFGHTVGHALEAATDYRRFLHGEAVAIGMVQAARISRLLGFCDDTTVARVRRLIQRAGLPTELPRELDLNRLAEKIELDKKSSGARVRFVCCTGIGATRFHSLEPSEIVRLLSRPETE